MSSKATNSWTDLQPFPGAFDCGPEDAPSGTLPYTDGVLVDASDFGNSFPYLNDPFPGSTN